MELTIPEKLPGESGREYAGRVLRTNIMTLRLKPGEVINEGETAGLLDMSRTPVHEALTHLREEWLVEIYPQRGTQVSRIDPGLVKEGYNTRLLLESELLRDEAGKVGRSDVQRLLDCLHEQERVGQQDPENIYSFIYLDDEFHRMMYFFGGRGHTWQAIRGLMSHYDRLRYLDALEHKLVHTRVIAEHRQFCDYLLMGLPDRVDPKQAIREHLTSFRGDLMNKIAAHPDYFTVE